MGGLWMSSKTMSLRNRILGWLLSLSVVLAWTVVWGQKGVNQDFCRLDPEKVVLPEACGECHRSTYAVWKGTVHSTDYEELHKKQAATEIASAMGFQLIKRNSLCLKCHYTPVLRRGDLWAGSGVGCESCHGAAKDWINVHNNYGVHEKDFQKARLLETSEHKRERQAAADQAGMLRPSSNLYAVVSNCFQCHTVPEEKLVNVGKHSTGSADFELVSDTKKIQHNFLDSFLTGDGTVNADRPIEHHRRLYFIGRALDLEYSLRGIAAAGEEGRYLASMVRRYRRAGGEMREISGRTDLPEAKQMLQATSGVSTELGNRDALLKAAAAVGQAARSFSERPDAGGLEALDALMSGTAEPLPTPPVEETSEAPAGSEEVVASDVPAAAPAAATPSTAAKPAERKSADETSSPAVINVPAVSQIGEILRRPPWQPVPSHRSIGPEVCSGCHDHSDQDDWWLSDKHYASADRLLDRIPKALEIAGYYGISADAMQRGDNICMQCHGSVVSGRENRTVISGVGCESCHGPGADFKEPHQKDREQGIRFGQADLRDLKTRAETCSKCHYITDARLLSAGHPSGTEFDLGERNPKIKHWKHALADPEALRAAYRAVIAARGPVPTIDPSMTAAALRAARANAAKANAARTPIENAASPGAAVRPTTAAPSAAPEAGGVDASPGGDAGSAVRAEARSASGPAAAAPSFDDWTPAAEAAQGLSIEDTLLLLKIRLERLYRAIASG